MITKKIVRPLEDAVNYFYVGVIPNACGTFCGYMAIEQAAEGRYGSALVSTFISLFNYVVGFSKFEEYRHVKKELESDGWKESIVKKKMYSWCQRHAAKQAAKQTGHLAEFEAFAESEGHKWYHLLPKTHKIDEVLGGDPTDKRD